MFGVLIVLLSFFQHFILPEYTAENTSSLILQSNIEHPFEEGDEIAAINSYGNVCGVVIWKGKNTAMNIFGSDQFAPEGFGYLYDEPMLFLWYDSSEDRELEIVFEYSDAQNYLRTVNTYQPYSIFLVNKITVLDNGLDSEDEEHYIFDVHSSYPNPFEQRLVIPITVPTSGNVSVYVYDIRGRLVTERNVDVSSGYNTIELRFPDLASGKYFLNLEYLGETKGITAIKIH